MFCKYCGEQVEEGARFCSECGKEVGNRQEEELPEGIRPQKNDNKKKVWLMGIIGGILLISFVLIGGLTYRNNQLEEFKRVIKQYEQVVQTNELGQHEEAYEELLEKAEKTLSRKKLSELKTLSAQLLKAQGEIENIQNQNNLLQTAYKDAEQQIEKLMIDEIQKSELLDLLSKWQGALETVNIEEGLSLQKEVEKQLVTLKNMNQTVVEDRVGQLNQADLSKAYPQEIERIEEIKGQVATKMAEGDYKEAELFLNEANQIVQQMNVVNDNLNLSLMQVDTTEYPNIRLYLEIRDGVTGEVPKQIEQGFFYLSEKLSTDSDYMKREIQKVVQLNEEENLNISIVADASGSMEGYPMESAKFIMSNFLEYVQFGIGDQVELIAFSDGVYPLIDFTTQKNMIREQIQYLQTGDMTSLYDALFTAVNRTAIQSGAKCIIAFTDGRDNHSQATADEVIELANRYGIPIFIVGIGDNILEDELYNIASKTNGFYKNIQDVNDLESIYQAIYRQQKELYVVEYETKAADKTFDTRDIQLAIQNRELGGSCEFSYTPNLVVGANQLLQGVSEVDDLVGNYLRGFVKAINSHDFSYLQEFVVTEGPLYKEVKPYVETKNITEKLLSYEIIEKQYVDQETCIVKVHETYEIQNEEDPLHLRILESEYMLKKQSDGKWKFYKFNNLIKILKKI